MDEYKEYFKKRTPFFLSARLWLQRVEHFIRRSFRDLDEVILNPAFDLGSRVVRGADIDLFMDGTLFEIKTWSRIQIKESLRQLVGYLGLAEIDRARNPDSLWRERRVSRLGWILPRHDVVRTVQVDASIAEAAARAIETWEKQEKVRQAEREAVRAREREKRKRRKEERRREGTS